MIFQLKSSVPSNVQTLTIPTIDTTKLTGQLSVVQELPEVSKLVFQEVKQEPDSIVNILENMKQESNSLSPLDYTVSSTTGETPLNLVNNLAKGVKRVTAPVQQIPHHSKRIKNVYVVQGQAGQQILQELPLSQLSSDQAALGEEQFCLEPPQSPNSNEVKKEPKSKSSSPKINNLNKSLNGSSLPSSKTCNWVFENGQVCGKTFSKSYNLVVHMRMHEDIRPFACTLCDQTFRQKAHLQRHETTHGIQSKNIYRQPAGGKKKKKKAGGQQLSKGLQNRLAKINQNLNKANGDLNEDSAGEEYMEDEEEDMYVPNGNQAKRVSLSTIHYSDNEHSNGLDNEMDNEEAIKLNNNINKVKQEVGDLNMNIITHHGEDDDTSTVENILHTVNSVPTLEQSLNCDNLLLRTIPQSRPIMSSQTAPNYPVNTSLPHITKLVESTSISAQQCGLPSLSSDLTTTSSHNLPGSYLPTSAQTNILFTTLNSPTTTVSAANKSLSFIETSVPAGQATASSFTSSSRQIVLDNIEEHSPEIQAEILNALLADQTGYVDNSQPGLQEVWEEEIYRLNSLPDTWWVSRKRRAGTNMDDVFYYSPQGYCFRNRSEIQDFLTNNTLPSDLRTDELRSPPLPIEQIPIIEDTYVHRQPANNNMDANSIAQALIANLKPEPLESLKEALTHTTRDSLSPSSTSASAIPDTDIAIPLSTVS